MAAVGVVYPLDHFLAPLMLKIHVYVGRFLAGFADETFEQQAAACGIDGGDAQHKTHGRVCSRTASLAQNSLAPGETDNGVHGQEIRRIIQAAYQLQFVMKLFFNRIGKAVRITPGRALPRQFLQCLLRCKTGDADLLRILPILREPKLNTNTNIIKTAADKLAI